MQTWLHFIRDPDDDGNIGKARKVISDCCAGPTADGTAGRVGGRPGLYGVGGRGQWSLSPRRR